MVFSLREERCSLRFGKRGFLLVEGREVFCSLRRGMVFLFAE